MMDLANKQMPEVSQEASLYAGHKKIYPQIVSGSFRRFKWGILILTLGIYYFLPFLRWDRGPGAPDQALLIDMQHRRAYFFFIEIWPQEVYYLTGLLIVAAMALFLMNAVAGRLWCGYLCPQTVWSDLFLAVETWVEGDRRERIKRDKEPWTFAKLRMKVTKHFLWLLIAWWTGGAWVLYFNDAPTVVAQLATFQADSGVWLWIGLLTVSTYTLAGFAREQVCTYMCPWPRIQAALTDEDALNVTYRFDRGEPRNSLKKAHALEAAGQKVGDCIDCQQCIAVCPTGVDIRKGIQLECIQCGLCIDACDAIMRKIGKPTRLIAYDTDLNIQRRMTGEPTSVRYIRPRTIIYATMILAVTGLMVGRLVTRADFGISVLHDRNPLYVLLSNGGVRNGYTVRLLNKKLGARKFVLDAKGVNDVKIRVVGQSDSVDGRPVVEVPSDTTRELRVLLLAPKAQASVKSADIVFSATDQLTGETSTVRDFFKARGE
jgi:cytochrome c oxidase accessory protein FixG